MMRIMMIMMMMTMMMMMMNDDDGDDGGGDDDNDYHDHDHDDDDDGDDDDYCYCDGHASHIDLHIESPPTWHFKNTQPFRNSGLKPSEKKNIKQLMKPWRNRYKSWKQR